MRHQDAGEVPWAARARVCSADVSALPGASVSFFNPTDATVNQAQI